MNAEAWAVVGTTIATVVFLIVPPVIYLYYALEDWIDDGESYRPVMEAVERSTSYDVRAAASASATAKG